MICEMTNLPSFYILEALSKSINVNFFVECQATASVDEFLQQLPSFDTEIAEKQQATKEAGEVSSFSFILYNLTVFTLLYTMIQILILRLDFVRC